MVKIRSLAIKVGKALRDHNMIQDKDRIIIAYSGGKDSFTLIQVLEYLKTKYNINCEFQVVTIDPGFDKDFENNIKNSLKEIDLPSIILPSAIKKVTEEKVDDGKDLCFFCARMRRGILYKYATENNFNKIALGHNLDDAIETVLLNMFFSSKISALKPSYKAKDYPVSIIRPQIYIDQDQIVEFINSLEFQPVKNNCPLKVEDSKRIYFRNFLTELKKQNPMIKESAKVAFQNAKENNFWGN